MATANQRAITIVEAAMNRPLTPAVRNRILAAFGSSEEFLDSVIGTIRHRVKMHEANTTDPELTPTPE